MSDLIDVRIGECQCPETPHPNGDYVYLRPILDLRGGFRVKRRLMDLNRAAQVARIQALHEAGTSVKELALRFELPPDDIKNIVLGRGEYQGPPPDTSEMEADLAESYLLEGIAEWNLMGPDGPLPVTADSIRSQLFTNYGRAEAAADKADDLYRPAVLDPLLRRALSSLPDTPTNESTSATNGHGPKRSKASKPSSTASIPMEDTVAIT
jgi:hypothetical protein